MPQGKKKTLAEVARFDYMLNNVNNLYVGFPVLILLDNSYPGRFWTQYEAWLSMQSVSVEGLTPTPKESLRCEIVPISNANPDMVASLVSMWANKNPRNAHAALARPDVIVTNKSDKENQLPKILGFNEKVKEAFQNARKQAVEAIEA